MLALRRLAVLSLLLLAPTAVAPDATHSDPSTSVSTSTTATTTTTPAPLGPHDHHFKGNSSSPDRGRKGGFALKGASGRLQLCPTGDCAQSVVDISMHHLHEVTAAGVVTEHRVKNFADLSFNWTAPVTALTAEGVNVTSSNFSASLVLDGVAEPVTYKAQVSYYQGNGTAKNGEQIIDVPAGGLKFALWIDRWPFLNASNSLTLGLHIASRNRTGAKAPKGNRTRGTGRDKKIDRVELQASMFLDSPSLALIDSAMVPINSSVAVMGDVVVVEYAFPKFASLYYDPVVSSTEDVSSTTTPISAESNTNLRSLAPAVAMSASSAALLALAAAFVSLVAH